MPLGDQLVSRNLSLPVICRQWPKRRIFPLFSILAKLTCSVFQVFRTLLFPQRQLVFG